MKTLRFVQAAIIAAAFQVSPLAAADEMQTVDIREWQVPYEASRPRDPFAESATSVWFVGQRDGYIAHLDASSGEMNRVELPEGESAHNLIVGSDGIVWYAGNKLGVIGRYDPEAEEIAQYPMPDPAVKDPHTLVFDDGEKNIWFTAQRANKVGRFNLETKEVDLIDVPTERARPYGIKMAPDGSVWVVLFGTYKLAHIDPQSLTLTEIDLPREEARPRRLEVTSDGRAWYGDYAGGRLGVYDPATADFTEWMLPGGEGARPYGMASDASGKVWAFETGGSPNRLVGFDPETEAFFSSTPVPSGGGTVRHTHYFAPSGAVWFGTDTNFVGRAIVEPAEEE